MSKEINKRERLMEIYDETITSAKSIMINKNKEYSGDIVGDTNPYENFDKSALEAGITPEQSWIVQFEKGYSAIKTYCKHGSTISDETISNRIQDAINYLIILRGLVDRKKNTELNELVDDFDKVVGDFGKD